MQLSTERIVNCHQNFHFRYKETNFLLICCNTIISLHIIEVKQIFAYSLMIGHKLVNIISRSNIGHRRFLYRNLLGCLYSPVNRIIFSTTTDSQHFLSIEEADSGGKQSIAMKIKTEIVCSFESKGPSKRRQQVPFFLGYSKLYLATGNSSS